MTQQPGRPAAQAAATHPLLTVVPDRLVIAGDWHGNGQWAGGRMFSAAAAGADILVHLGDFGVWPGAGGVRYLDALEKLAARNNLPILFIDGNHDDHDQLHDLEMVAGLGYVRDHIWHLPRGMRWEWGRLRFAALGGATSVDKTDRTPGQTWWPQEAITEHDVRRFVAGGPVDVVLTHDRPAGVVTPGITREAGIAEWGEEAIDEAGRHGEILASALIPTHPKLVFHGHLHRRYTTTWHYPGGSARVEGLDCDGRPGNTLRLTMEDLALLDPEWG